MAEAEDKSKYGKISSTKVKFHDDEPVFLIRATDPFATQAVIEYARRAEKDGCEKSLVDEAFDHAMRIAEWQRHNPDLVKPLPD